MIARAGALEAGDYRRWPVIGELATVDFKVVFERASGLIRTSDPAAMTLGAQILDHLFIGMREGRRFTRRAEELLREVCRPTQEPGVLAAALPPYAQVSQDAQSLLYELLEHPDAQVRRTAAQLIVGASAEFAEDRQVDALIGLLDRDPDEGVREQAAEGLELVLTCYPYVPQGPRIGDALASRLDDPVPGIRAAALAGISADDIDEVVKRLVSELAVADPGWQFVDAFNRHAHIEFCDADLRHEARTALRRLRDEGWAEHADPARFPSAQERADMLEKAIAAISVPARM